MKSLVGSVIVAPSVSRGRCHWRQVQPIGIGDHLASVQQLRSTCSLALLWQEPERREVQRREVDVSVLRPADCKPELDRRDVLDRVRVRVARRRAAGVFGSSSLFRTERAVHSVDLGMTPGPCRCRRAEAVEATQRAECAKIPRGDSLANRRGRGRTTRSDCPGRAAVTADRAAQAPDDAACARVLSACPAVRCTRTYSWTRTARRTGACHHDRHRGESLPARASGCGRGLISRPLFRTRGYEAEIGFDVSRGP